MPNIVYSEYRSSIYPSLNSHIFFLALSHLPSIILSISFYSLMAFEKEVPLHLEEGSVAAVRSKEHEGSDVTFSERIDTDEKRIRNRMD